MRKKGLYHAYAPEYKHVLVDKDYNGFKIVYKKCDMPKMESRAWMTDSTEVKSMVDGKVYTSKAKYYQSLKDKGSHVIEKGEGSGVRKDVRGDYNVRKELTQAVHRHFH